MPAACRSSLRSALLVAVLFVLGATPAWSQTPERHEISVHRLVDNFIAYLKSETQDAAREAARLVRENQDLIDEAKVRVAAQIDALKAALSRQKQHLEPFGEDASAMWDKFTETAVSSLSIVERHAVRALDWVMGFMRTETQSDQGPEIPV